MDDAAVDAKIEELKKVDYERIGEREYVEFVTVRNCGRQRPLCRAGKEGCRAASAA